MVSVCVDGTVTALRSERPGRAAPRLSCASRFAALARSASSLVASASARRGGGGVEGWRGITGEGRLTLTRLREGRASRAGVRGCEGAGRGTEGAS